MGPAPVVVARRGRIGVVDVYAVGRHERQAARRQHPSDLAHHRGRVQHMLQDLRTQDHVVRAVVIREFLGGPDVVDLRARRTVETTVLGRVRREERQIRLLATPDVQHAQVAAITGVCRDRGAEL